MSAGKARALLGSSLVLILILGLVALLAPEPSCRIARYHWKGISVWTGGNCDLEPGKPLQVVFREHSILFSHVYGLSLEAGQFLDLTVDQDEIDVSAALQSPEHKELLKVDLPAGAPERIYFVAPRRGRYWLIVEPEEKNESGSAQVVVRAIRAPSESDRLRARAVRLFSEGTRCLKGQQRSCAAKKFTAALALWKTLRDSWAASEAYYQLGLTQSDVTPWENQVLPAWRGTAREPVLLNRLGDYCYQQDPARALDYHRKALSAAQGKGRHRAVAHALIGLTRAYMARGEVQEGLSMYRTARELLRSKRDLAELDSTVGHYLLDRGDFEQAVQFLDQSLELSRDLEDRYGRALAMSDKGMAQAELGNYNEGAKTLRGALSLAQEGHLGPDRETYILNDLGTLYVERYERQRPDSTDLKKATSCFSRSLSLARKAKNQPSEAIALSYLGHLLDLEKKTPQAVELFTRAYHTSPKEYPMGRVGPLYGRARARRSMGQLEAALADVEEAIRTLEGLRQSSKSSSLRATFVSFRRRIYEFQIALLVELHEKNPRRGYAEQAFEKSEAFRARSFLEDLVARGPFANANPEQLRKLDKIEARLGRLTKLSSPPADLEKEASELLLQREGLLAELRGRKARERPARVLLGTREVREQLLDKDTLILAYMVGDEESFLFVLSREKINLYRLAGGKQISKQAKLVAGLFPQSVSRERWESWKQEAAKLSNLLLAPAAEHFGRRRLIILRGDPLNNIPLEALPDPRELSAGQKEGHDLVSLMDRNEVIYAPSASVLATLLKQRRGRSQFPKQLAAFGDPVFSREGQGAQGKSSTTSPFEALPFSRKEVESITKLLPQGQYLKLLGLDAQRETILDSGLEKYRFLHFATHSVLDPALPELSSLVFSMFDKDGQPQDGRLWFYEISALNLPVDMVVLSACRTGSGKEIRGEGAIGLGRAFLHAGASRVVVSLWDVEEKSTAALMQHFYEGIFRRKLSPPEALRQARIFVRSQPGWQAPYYWAPFILEGDWH